MLDLRKSSAIVPTPSLPKRASRRSLRGLDAFTFFVADVQTGFGPFIAIYLTTHAWTETSIGLLLTVAQLISLVGQMPGGAIVDAVRSERRAAAAAVIAISVSAALIAISPSFLAVFVAQILHAGASCILGPAIAAISLGLVGHAAAGERFGRNARFASIGNALAAAGMGAAGYLLSDRSVFWLTALLGVPTLLAIARIREAEVDPVRAHGGAHAKQRLGLSVLKQFAGNRPLLILAASVMFFNMANAAMLPLVGSILTLRSAHWATVLVAAAIVVPQMIVAVLSPLIGRRAQQWGRRPLLLIGLAALPIRGLLFAVISNPYLLVATQLLDGIAAAALGVLVPLIVADATRGTGRFNLAQGVVGSAMGIGASISTTLAGYVGDTFGNSVAFLSLAGLALAGLALTVILMPETRFREPVSKDAPAHRPEGAATAPKEKSRTLLSLHEN